MKHNALGKGIDSIVTSQQPCSNIPLPQLARTNDPPSSHIAAEDMTASGKREKHRQIIMEAMRRLKATKLKPCTGLQIANESGLTNVEVMRRLRTCLAYYDLAKSTDAEDKIKCPVDGKRKLGWWLTVT